MNAVSIKEAQTFTDNGHTAEEKAVSQHDKLHVELKSLALLFDICFLTVLESEMKCEASNPNYRPHKM